MSTPSGAGEPAQRAATRWGRPADLSGALTTLAADVIAGRRRSATRGVVRLIECADAPLAALIAKDLRARCTLVGERHLAVPVEGEHYFRRALRRLGYVPTRD